MTDNLALIVGAVTITTAVITVTIFFERQRARIESIDEEITELRDRQRRMEELLIPPPLDLILE